MSLLSNHSDMLDFINSKIMQSKKIQFNKVFQFFIKIMTKALIDPIDKLSSEEYSIICYDIVFNVFWTLFHYTKNIKLTMFLCDRSIELFNEYMEMILAALNSNLLSQNKIKIKPTDIKLFIYNKTIGPITFQKMERMKMITKKRFSQCKSACMSIQILIKSIFTLYHINKQSSDPKKHIENDNFDYLRVKSTILEEIIENSSETISYLIYLLHTKEYGSIADSIVQNEIAIMKSRGNIQKTLYIIHRKLYLVSQLIRKNRNINKITQLDAIFSILLQNKLFHIDQDINTFYTKKYLDSDHKMKLLVKDALKLSKRKIPIYD